MLKILFDILFPRKCVGCGKVGSYFCPSCVRDIKQTDLVCPRCEKPSIGGQTHPICKRRFGLDGLWSLGVYQDPLRSAIGQLKYKGIKELAEILTDITIEYWAKYQPFVLDKIKKDRGVGWVVIPVPMHWLRANKRGFNQSNLIGQNLSKKLGLAYSESLKRIRYTKSQTKLKEKQRRQNIKDAFEISIPYTLDSKPSVLLIDDVWTTGSTLKECCWVLKRAGAKQVWALTLAR
ncbi:ComF family protein [Candidatus Daviesbacteria bacterium]|nr:ComF family protein [Candidatus Daviesbacteria bacterium]